MNPPGFKNDTSLIGACGVCVWGRYASDPATARCVCIDVTGLQKSNVAALEARSARGMCGPEARFLILRSEAREHARPTADESIQTNPYPYLERPAK